MAENLLVKEALTPEMIDSGRRLVAALDQTHWTLTAAFWIFDLEQNRWKLILASPRVENEGPRPAYELVTRILSEHPDSQVNFLDVSIVPPRKDLVKLLSKAVQTGDGIAGIRFSRNTIDGRYIPDAYIYRSRLA